MNPNEIEGLFRKEEKYEMTIVEGKLIPNDRALQAFEEARLLNQQIKELTDRRDTIINALKKAMKDNNVDEYDGKSLRAKKVPSTTVETVNTDAMKKDGIYEKYLLLIPRDGYTKVTYKGGKK